MKKLVILIGAIFCLSYGVAFSQADPAKTEDTKFSTEEKIKIYRQMLKTETDPKALAQAHFKIGESLESLGKDTEATAEYLKVVLDPEAGELSKDAERRLSKLYNKFSATESTPPKEETSTSAKDPAIFFNYIKSLYETYMEQGKYDKAIYLLNKLIKMDETNQSYYEDLGNIYLNGYNNPDEALRFYNHLLTINPNHTKVYVDMGLAYEKKSDIPNAIMSYKKAIELSPYNSWSMYGLSRLEAINLAKEKKLVKDWYLLGPFPNTDRKGMEKDFGPEKNIGLNQKFKEGETTIEWFRPFGYDDSGSVDLNNIFKVNDNVVAYALTYAYSENDKNVQFRIGTSDPICVWVNKAVVFKEDVVLSPSQYDKNIVNVALKKGWNEVLLKTSESFGVWEFYFRVTDEAGNTPYDVIFDPVQDTARAKKIYNNLRKHEKIEFAKLTTMFTLAIGIFLAGVYLLISNIYHKVKIRQMKEDFIASVSHELKTPLAAIKMFAETLSMGRVREAEKIKEYYATIIRETDRLTRFINKILDFQKIEKKKKIYSFEEVDVVELLNGSLDIYMSQIQDEELVIEKEYDKDIPKLELDEDAMLQVFLNLLTNAYKYSIDERYIKLKVAKNENCVLISIIDHGMGIPRDKLIKIFDKFYRVDRDATKDIKGSGIGLAFVKSVIEAHGGKIAVESQLDKGSTFMISLPIERGS